MLIEMHFMIIILSISHNFSGANRNLWRVIAELISANLFIGNEWQYKPDKYLPLEIYISPPEM